MSDIPIGSPPSPPGRHAAPSGWYPDPVDAAQERYWDGWQWSRNTRPLGGGAVLPPMPGGSGVQNPYAPGPGYPYEPGSPASGSPPYPGGPQPSPYGSGPQPSPYGSGPQPPPYPGAPTQPSYPGYPPQPGYPVQAPALRPAPWGGTPQATMTADGVPLAGWWWRVLAVVLDSIVVGLLVTIPAFPIYRRTITAITAFVNETMQAAQTGQPPPSQPPVTELISPSDQLLLIAIQIGVALLYHLLFLRWKSATPGKLICGLRVVPVGLGRSGEPLPWGSIVPRVLVWVLPAISAFLLVVRVIDGLFPLWHAKRQALHDLAGRTQVVRTRL